MPNKTIPELAEIDLGDVEDTNLFMIDNGITSLKLRVSTLMDFLVTIREPVDVVFDGVETGDKIVDVTTYSPDATKMIWMLRKPSGEQMSGPPLEITDDATITIKAGDFALDAGTYTLLGV